MTNSRMIAKRQCTIFMSHTCSQCGFPLISVVQIRSESQKTYTFSRDKAGQIASDTAEKAINDEIHRIEACRRNRTVLVGKIKKSSMISPGYFCDASISGHRTKCPYCGNLEPWKDTSSNEKAMTQLEDDNFPVVFKNVNDAENWAKENVNELIQTINDKRQNPEEVKNAISAVSSIRQALDRYLELSASIPEKEELIQLKKQLEDLKIRKGQLGILDLKGKRENSSAIKMTESKIAEMSKIVDAKDAPYLEQIRDNRYNLLYTQAMAFGCTNKITSIRNDNAFSYQYVANDIPEEFLKMKNKEIPELTEGHGNYGEAQKTNTDQDSAPLFCRKCGYKLLPGSAFCTRCGAKV